MPARYSGSTRVTLAPTPIADATERITLFHAALAVWNFQHDTTLTWDELSQAEQRDVRTIYERTRYRLHPCQKRA